MLRLALLCLGLVACVRASDIDHCCSAADVRIVQTQWKSLWKDTESSKVKSGVAKLLLLKLTEKHADAAGVFKDVNIANPKSPEFTAHAMRVINGMDMAINLLSDPDALEKALEHLADQHAARTGVKKEHFRTFGEILNAGLPKVLDKYNEMSWKSCLRGVLRKIAAKLP